MLILWVAALVMEVVLLVLHCMADPLSWEIRIDVIWVGVCIYWIEFFRKLVKS